MAGVFVWNHKTNKKDKAKFCPFLFFWKGKYSKDEYEDFNGRVYFVILFAQHNMLYDYSCFCVG